MMLSIKRKQGWDKPIPLPTANNVTSSSLPDGTTETPINEKLTKKHIETKIKSAIIVFVPIKIVSEANIHDHWYYKKIRRQKVQEIIDIFLRPLKLPSLPCLIKLTRIAPRKLDYDNLCFAQKPVLDIICDHLLPGLLRGQADSNIGIKVEYFQEKGKPKEYGIKIEIIPL